MSRITMCIDCPMYQSGGYCRHKKKDVGALQPACDHALKMNEKFNPGDEDAVLEPVAPAAPEPKTPRQMEYKSEPAPAPTKEIAAVILDESKKATGPSELVRTEPTECPLAAYRSKRLVEELRARAYRSKRLVEELRARGYSVTCTRPVTVIEAL